MKDEIIGIILRSKKDYMTPKSFDEYYKGEKKKRDDLRLQHDSDHHTYHDSIITYLIGKESFRHTGKLISAYYYTNAFKYAESNLLDIFGGQPEWAQPTGEITSKNGTPLIFITQLTGYFYHNGAPDKIYLFYDEEAQEVVQVFQWT